MGGYGSGRRWYCGANATTSDFGSIDVRRWQREGMLTPGRNFNWQWSRNGERVGSIHVITENGRIVLDYRHRNGGGEWKEEKYPVLLTWTPCHLGGERPWFICPARGCGRRVAKLYGGGIFACRHCYRLAYDCQREGATDRGLRRADKNQGPRGGPGVLNGNRTETEGKALAHL